MLNRQPAVYIMTNKRNGTLYTGVTCDLIKRVYQHKEGVSDGFTKNISASNGFITSNLTR